MYVRFRYEADAQKAMDDLNNRFYAGRPIWAELCPVNDFREGEIIHVKINIVACCRKLESGDCNRAGLCNFMHLKLPANGMKRDLFESQRKSIRILKESKPVRTSRSRSRTRKREF